MKLLADVRDAFAALSYGWRPYTRVALRNDYLDAVYVPRDRVLYVGPQLALAAPASLDEATEGAIVHWLTLDALADAADAYDASARARHSAPPTSGRLTPLDRATRYLDALPAFQSPGRRTALWKASRALVKGFALHPQQAYDMLAAHPASPPFTAREVSAVVKSAQRAPMATGYLLDRGR